ncbi:MAG: histidine kinase [Brasilonema sp.]
MNHWLKTQSHPVRFLFYLQWGLLLLAIAFSFKDATALAESVRKTYGTTWSAIAQGAPPKGSRAIISLAPLLVPQVWQLFDLLMLAMFALLGVMLPSGKLAAKVLYIGMQFSLVLAWLAFSRQLWLLPVLLLIIVIRSCFLLPLAGSWTLAGFILAIMLLTRVQQLSSSHTPALEDSLSQWSDIFWFGIVLLLVMQLIHYVFIIQKIQQQLAREQQRWQQYTQQQQELTALKARHRVAYESYDALGHALIAINIQLQSAVKLWSIDPNQAQKFLAQAQRLGVTTMEEIRNCVRVLRMHNLPPRAELSCETKDQETSQEIRQRAEGKRVLGVLLLF